VSEQQDFPQFAAPDEGAGPEETFVAANDEQAFLFGQTDRPQEAITTGVPVGPGADFSRFAAETDQQFLARVDQALVANPSKDVQDFRRLIAKGL
jgi:hypothetical protein